MLAPAHDRQAFDSARGAGEQPVRRCERCREPPAGDLVELLEPVVVQATGTGETAFRTLIDVSIGDNRYDPRLPGTALPDVR